MPHGEMTLSGPGIIVGGVVIAVVFIAMIVLVVDALRRPRYHFGKLGPWGYVGIAFAYFLVCFGVVFIRVTGFGATIAGPLFLALLFGTIFMGITEIVYLLGVVFPDEKDREKRATYEKEHNIKPRAKKDKKGKPLSAKTEVVDERKDGEYFDDVE